MGAEVLMYSSTECLIGDDQEKKDWEDLLGIKIMGDKILVPYPTWLHRHAEISAIQVASIARRLK